MKSDVSYKLDNCIRKEIVCVKNLILHKFNNASIFLFGSIAKGKYKNNSDIDILLLLDKEMDIKETRRVRHNIEDLIETLKVSRSVDIKLYSEERYEELCKQIGFERGIQGDLIDIRSWSING